MKNKDIEKFFYKNYNGILLNYMYEDVHIAQFMNEDFLYKTGPLAEFFTKFS